jgi:hypothetical protein
MPSVYLLFCSYLRTTSASSSKINFGPLSQQSSYRGFQPMTHNGTGSAGGILLQVYRGDGSRYYSNPFSDTVGNFTGCAFSSSDQKIRSGQNAVGDGTTTAAATTLSFAAGATWLLGPFENTSTTSTELTIASACLFWDSNVALSPKQTTDIDSLVRSFTL